MKLDIQATPTFDRIFNIDKRVIALRGGSRSGKSYALMQIVVIWLYTGTIGGKFVPEGLFTIARSTFPALRKSVMKDFLNYLVKLKIYNFIDHKKSINSFSYKMREVVFISTDDEHKLRGVGHEFVWLNECNDMPYMVFVQVILRTEFTVFLDANPSGEPWFKTEIEERRIKEEKDVFLDVSTFKDNPFLPDAMVKEIMNLKTKDPDLYKVYTLGEWIPIKGLIYPKFEYIQEMPEIYDAEETFGLDFGFTNPSCFVRVLRFGDNLYIDQLFHEAGLLNNEIAERILEHNPRRVFCDSQEPRNIKELRQRGINAHPAKKGADSVRQGINFIKQHRLFLTVRSSEGAKEWKLYKWDEDLNGKLLDKPIKENDHFSDAVRYALNKIIGVKMKIL